MAIYCNFVQHHKHELSVEWVNVRYRLEGIVDDFVKRLPPLLGDFVGVREVRVNVAPVTQDELRALLARLKFTQEAQARPVNHPGLD